MAILTEEEILSPPLKEHPTKELKGKKTDNIARTIAAFLNTEGGLLIFGLDNNGAIVDPHNIDLEKIQDEVQRSITQTISPNPFPMGLVEIFSNPFRSTNLLIFRVKKSPTTHFCSGGLIFRQGSSNNLLTVKSEVMRVLSRDIDEERYWSLTLKKLKKISDDVNNIDELRMKMSAGNAPDKAFGTLDYHYLEFALPFIQVKLKDEGLLEDYLEIMDNVRIINDAITAMLNNPMEFLARQPNMIGRFNLSKPINRLTQLLLHEKFKRDIET